MTETPATKPTSGSAGSNLADRIRSVTATEPDADAAGRGGRPTNDERRRKAQELLEELTGKRVELVDPDQRPGDIYTAEEMGEIKLECEGAFAELAVEGSAAVGEKIEDSKFQFTQKEARLLGKFWNRAFAFIFGKWYLKMSPIAAAVILTVALSIGRMVKILRWALKTRVLDRVFKRKSGPAPAGESKS